MPYENEGYTPDNSKTGKQVVYDSSHHVASMRAHANARRMAIDLAHGTDSLDDPEDTDVFYVPNERPNDDRRYPLVWEESFCLKYTACEDGYASYGRKPHPTDCRFVPKREAIMEFKADWHSYQHMGDHIP